MSEKQMTRREFNQGVATSLPLLIQTDEGGIIDEDGDGEFLDDLLPWRDNAESGTGTIIAVGTESQRTDVDSSEAEMYFALSGTRYEPDGNGGWTEIESTGPNPAYDTVEADEVSSRQYKGGGWSYGTDSGQNRSEGLAIPGDGVVYYGLGKSKQGTIDLSDWNKYDPDEDTHTSLTSAPGAVANPMSPDSYNGKIFVFGGTDGSGNVTDTTRIYDIGNDSWSTGTAIPTTLDDGVAVGPIDGKIYVGTGQTGGGSATDAWYEYDPSTDGWTTKTNLTGSPRQEAIGATIGGYAYVAGGRDTGTGSADISLDDAWKYDPSADTWTELPSPPVAVSDGGAAVLNDELYVIGGWTRPDDSSVAQAVDRTFKLDPKAETWEVVSALPYPEAKWNMHVAGIGNKIVAIGGVRDVDSQTHHSTTLLSGGGFPVAGTPRTGYPDELSSDRSLDTWYKNGTGRSLKVNVSVASSANGTRVGLNLYIGESQTKTGTKANEVTTQVENNNRAQITGTVPPGGHYHIEKYGSTVDYSLSRWFEQIQ